MKIGRSSKWFTSSLFLFSKNCLYSLVYFFSLFSYFSILPLLPPIFYLLFINSNFCKDHTLTKLAKYHVKSTGAMRTGTMRTGTMRTGTMRTGATRTGAMRTGAMRITALRDGISRRIYLNLKIPKDTNFVAFKLILVMTN